MWNINIYNIGNYWFYFTPKKQKTKGEHQSYVADIQICFYNARYKNVMSYNCEAKAFQSKASDHEQ